MTIDGCSSNLRRMTDEKILAEVEAYCSKMGLSPSTVCVRATGNSRLMDRIRRRLDQLDTDIERLRVFMIENPPPASSVEEDAA